MNCLKNTIFPIKFIFKNPDQEVQGDWFLITGRMRSQNREFPSLFCDVVPSGRLELLLSQLLRDGVTLYGFFQNMFCFEVISWLEATIWPNSNFSGKIPI